MLFIYNIGSARCSDANGGNTQEYNIQLKIHAIKELGESGVSKCYKAAVPSPGVLVSP